MGPFLRKHLTVKNFYPIHDDPTIFITCQWQKDRTKPNLLYLLYRTIVMLIFFVTWIYSIIVESGAGKYPIFLTNWGYTGCTIQSLLAFFMLSTAVLAIYFQNMVKLHKVVLKLYPIYWLLNTVTTPTAFAITTVYWSILFDGNSQYRVMNYFVHGNNSVMMFLDLCMVSHPIRFLHVIYTIVLGLTYVLFTLIYYLAGGTGYGGARYIYSIVDWSKPSQTIGVCLGVIMFQVVLHMVIILISFVRMSIAKKFRSKQFDISIKETKRQTSFVNEAMLSNVV
ncbi:protein rolling stone-like [Diorhabda carinulata]|uniref:protein rolling stone-like n=1 Tax=Diorhabda carinulata TaxID=1163345 RepID=UPI0025A00ED4|nr:protein rolling stone-like [Diorhabda carinulata]XP_057660398.1 protein rolling stone-like [Diorhabda carinulata]XP_057660405.1 protein rolling stone-like [Diorhabda carinulata]XP_057660415.1 protein rolling stone-like [Diorhabda carinulata]